MLPARVWVLTRQGCHLCEEALSVVAQVCGDVGCGWRAVDVDSDPRLRAAYTDHVPVTFADETLHGYWFVDRDRLRQDLLQRPASGMADDWRPPLPERTR